MSLKNAKTLSKDDRFNEKFGERKQIDVDVIGWSPNRPAAKTTNESL